MAVLQNKTAYITGSSRGIGKAISLKLLELGYKVVGLSRNSTISHSNFTHFEIDLSDLNSVCEFEFDLSAKDVLLINNAGMIGEISPIGAISNQCIEDVIKVNTIAPQQLMNRFIQTYMDKASFAHILNISSGAGKRPIGSWATYCASKAALDLFSETIDSEWKERNIENWYIHSVAPGVVDTTMQEEIRNSTPETFKSHNNFVELKKNNELSTPITVADKLIQIIRAPKKFQDVIFSVRDFE